MRLKVKFCGFTHPDDLQAALSLGVDYAGFVFAPGSKRNLLTDEKTWEWIKPIQIRSKIPFVAVFANYEPSQIEQIIKTGIFSILQISLIPENFNQSISTYQKIKYKFNNKQNSVTKVISVWYSLSLNKLSQYIATLKSVNGFPEILPFDGLILDSLDEQGYGGQGKTVEPHEENLRALAELHLLCERQRKSIPIFLAGGLNPENILRLLMQWGQKWQITSQKIKYPFPFHGVDLSGGIEIKNVPGKPRKDFHAMNSFFNNLEQYGNIDKKITSDI